MMAIMSLQIAGGQPRQNKTKTKEKNTKREVK
jgi:hypothetical protein